MPVNWKFGKVDNPLRKDPLLGLLMITVGLDTDPPPKLTTGNGIAEDDEAPVDAPGK